MILKIRMAIISVMCNYQALIDSLWMFLPAIIEVVG